MALMSCKLCGRAFNSEGRKVCNDCMMRLEQVYSQAHEYLRDNEDEKIDTKKLADAMDVDPRDVQELVEMGWLERIMPSSYDDDDDYNEGSQEKRRQRQFQEFSGELEKMKTRRKMTTYGGDIYARTPRGR